jgi:tetratricopeptide (TPR) repeat protein
MNRRRTSLTAVLCSLLLISGLLGSFSTSTIRLLGQTTESLTNSTGSSDEQAATGSQTSLAPRVTPELQGDIFMASRRYVEAINAYMLGPSNSAVIWNKMGVAYHHLFAFNEAKKNYQRALQLNPKYAEALNNLGSIYYEEKNYRRSERYYKKALKIAPDAAVTYCNLGTAYFAAQKYKLGSEAYQKALSIDPEIFDRDSLGKIEHQGPPGQRATLSYYLAKTYAQAGKTEKAIEYLRKAFDSGFNDRKKLMEDQEFSALRKTPEFQKLLKDENIHWQS